MCSLDSDPKGT